MASAFSQTPFNEAINFLKEKVDLPSEKWTDMWEGMHSRAFVVAGAMKSELLTDFHNAINTAIKDGKTLNDFRKEFDFIVKKYGWNYKGARGWRTGVIFNTNMRTAYSAGNYAQMSDPDVLKSRPFLRYIGGLSKEPRPLHLKWSGTVLRHGDPWWNTHWPPNGWGCKCKVVSHSKRELDRGGMKVSASPNDGFYTWENPDTKEFIEVPAGIDPGWAYNPGMAKWGKMLEDDVMAAWKKEGAKAWDRLTPGNWRSYERPETIPLSTPSLPVDRKIPATVEGVISAFKKEFMAEETVASFKSGGFYYDVIINADSLSNHLKDGGNLNRAPYISLLKETFENPWEVWLCFEKHKGTGKVELRQRMIKAFALEGESDKGLLISAQAAKGFIEAVTFFPVSNMKYLNQQREGKLIFKKE